MNPYAQTSDASQIYRESTGTLIARPNASAITPYVVREVSAAVEYLTVAASQSAVVPARLR